jgi:hypothetical protein
MMRKSPFVFDKEIIIQIKYDLGKCANCLQIGHEKFECEKILTVNGKNDKLCVEENHFD